MVAESSDTPEMPFEAWIWTKKAKKAGAAKTQRFPNFDEASAWLASRIEEDPYATDYGIADETSGTRRLVYMSPVVQERLARELGDEAPLCSVCRESQADGTDSQQGPVCDGCAQHLGVANDIIDTVSPLNPLTEEDSNDAP